MQYISSWCITGGANALARTCDHFLNEGLTCYLAPSLGRALCTVHIWSHCLLSSGFLSFLDFSGFLHSLLQCTAEVSRLFYFFSYDQRHGIALYTDFRTPNYNGFNTEVDKYQNLFQPNQSLILLLGNVWSNINPFIISSVSFLQRWQAAKTWIRAQLNWTWTSASNDFESHPECPAVLEMFVRSHSRAS